MEHGVRRQRLSRLELIADAERAGWAVKELDHRELQIWRWGQGLTMTQLTVLLDPLGRVQAWSEWERTRVGTPDQETGRRDRLMQRIVAL